MYKTVLVYLVRKDENILKIFGNFNDADVYAKQTEAYVDEWPVEIKTDI